MRYFFLVIIVVVVFGVGGLVKVQGVLIFDGLQFG